MCFFCCCCCFFWSLLSTLDYEWGFEHKLTLPSGSAPSLPQQFGTVPAAMLMPHQTACPPHTPFSLTQKQEVIQHMKLTGNSVRKTISLCMPTKILCISCYHYAPLLIILFIQSQSDTLSLSTNQSLAVKFKSALSLSAVIQLSFSLESFAQPTSTAPRRQSRNWPSSIKLSIWSSTVWSIIPLHYHQRLGSGEVLFT